MYVSPLVIVKVAPSSPYFLILAKVSPQLLVRAAEDPENATVYLYGSYNNMQYSFDEEVVELSRNVSVIITLIWLNLIFALISHLGILLNLIKKKIASKILFISCISIITSIAILFLVVDFMQKIQINQNLENSALIVIDFPIKYIHLIILASIVCLFGSAMYSKIILSSKINYMKNFKGKYNETQTLGKKDEIQRKDGEKINNEIKTNDGKDLKFRIKTPLINDEYNKNIDKGFSEKVDKKDNNVPFNYRNQNEPAQHKNNNSMDQKRLSSKKFNVKCPQCGSIFEAEKELNGITKIKCPQCGKEGVIR
jgi:hypothetical protein